MIAARSTSLSRFFTPPPGKLTKKPLLDGGSADPERNIALFNALKKARADGVPKANIESALQKASMYTVLRPPPDSYYFRMLRQRVGKMVLDNM